VPEVQPRQLLEQANFLASTGSGPGASGRPRDVDLRRAISASYYAVFHEITARCVEDLAGATRHELRRKMQHAQIDQFSKWVNQAGSAGPKELRPVFEDLAKVAAIRDFADSFVQLIALRHAADYDHLSRFTRSNVLNSVEMARFCRQAIGRIRAPHRRLFMTTLIMAREARV
jgi:hypothetical protein